MPLVDNNAFKASEKLQNMWKKHSCPTFTKFPEKNELYQNKPKENFVDEKMPAPLAF